jgi:uncharacterized protein YyaL (SSP411 family)
MIPHFEKMLYDNAQLLRVYAQAAIATGEKSFHEVAADTAQWIMREMQSPEGAYWSSFDADSEGDEGRFYVWTVEEVRSALEPETFEVVARRYGLDHPANFEDRWHLHVQRSLESIASELGITNEAGERHIVAAKRALLEARNKRVWPGLDDKVLTSWNGLAIAAMAIAGRALRESAYSESAFRALDFVRNKLFDNGRLFAVYAGGRARFPAYLDDYAFMLDGVLEALQTSWRSEDLHFAISLADALLAHFEDRASGGFYFTADDHEGLIHRFKSFADEALPAGNAIAAQALTRLGLLLGEPRYLDAAARTLRATWSALERHPHAHAAMLTALEEHLDPPQIVIVRGAHREISQWQQALDRIYAPKRLVFAIPSDAKDLPREIADKQPQAEVIAYVCRGTVCSAPIHSLPALLAAAS